MKKASSIVYFISGVLLLLVAGAYVALGVAATQNGQFVIDIVAKYVPEIQSADAAMVNQFLQIFSTAIMALAAFPVIAAILAFVAGATQKKGLHIACIIFGVLNGHLPLILAAILGLIASKKK